MQFPEDRLRIAGWHWEDKNKLTWAKQRLVELLIGLTADSSEGQHSITTTAVTDIRGEALITTRKGGKMLPLFDLTVVTAWEAQVQGKDDKIKGDIKVEEFASGSDAEDYIFTTSVTGTGTQQDECKRLAEMLLKPKILAQLEQFINDMNQLQS